MDGRWPPASPAQAKTADAELNVAYGRAMAFLASTDNLSTEKPDDARRCERAWIRYRDAFLAFARAAAPQAIAARLTQERVKDLKDLAN
jgi:uncharacterized protein YecT (DUF1311 family)